MRSKRLYAVMLALGIMICVSSGLADPPVQTEGITVPVIEYKGEFKIPDTEAMAMLRDMKCGWNLGNTFDAYNGYTGHFSGTGMESSWVGIKTSKKVK